jgi:IS4 transposase
MDWNLTDFARLYRLQEAGSFFVIRGTSNLKAKRRYSHAVDSNTRFTCDKTAIFTGFYAYKDFEKPLQRICFKDSETDKALIFLTNNFALQAMTITELYQCRRQIKLFFKRIKQHLHIKALFGASENVVKTQISVYVLVAIVKKRLNIVG